MTKNLLRNLPLIAAFLAAYTINNKAIAQKLSPPNAGFEAGTGNTADKWSITYFVERVQQYTGNINGQPVTVNPAEGQYFLKLTTTVNPNVQLPPRIAIAKIKIPYIGHPDSMVVKTAYFPKIQEDGFRIEFDFLKYDSATQMSNSVLSTSFSGFDSSNWISTVGDFTYIFGKPNYDTLEIRILSANPGQHNQQTGAPLYGAGTVLLVDDLAFYGDEMVTHVKPVSANDIKLTVYPNPCTTTATIETEHLPANAKVIITDVRGRIVKETAVFDNAQNIDLSGVEAGIYFGTLVSEHTMQSFKLVVQQ